MPLVKQPPARSPKRGSCLSRMELPSTQPHVNATCTLALGGATTMILRPCHKLPATLAQSRNSVCLSICTSSTTHPNTLLCQVFYRTVSSCLPRSDCLSFYIRNNTRRHRTVRSASFLLCSSDRFTSRGFLQRRSRIQASRHACFERYARHRWHDGLNCPTWAWVGRWLAVNAAESSQDAL